MRSESSRLNAADSVLAESETSDQSVSLENWHLCSSRQATDRPIGVEHETVVPSFAAPDLPLHRCCVRFQQFNSPP